ncbi:MAG: hypothetical protein BWX73_03210 [Lentisphaerae bacterium ADurb.Bin082]|nr:MAG: hypothetical protein BWX73_03210 [Lentisphaerae bacterium ADurb.Bin082]HQL87071.1 ATP-binding protein [Lentisphaeria bacterium]
MYIKRNLVHAFLEANTFFPALLVTGARQVGKTTFLHHNAEPERCLVSLDPLDMRVQAKEDPRLFLANHPPPVLIDEIQYAPELLPYIKQIIDEVRNRDRQSARGLFWLTGSQQFGLMKGVSESLAGRIGIFNLHGLSQAELAGRDDGAFLPERDFSAPMEPVSPLEVFTRIWRGSFPELVMEEHPEKHWERFYQSYLQTYLSRDVRALTQVADEHRFYVFLKAVAARTGQMLNYSSLARDAEISQPTAKSYLSILETSGLVKLLYPYLKNRNRQMISTPKLYMLDTGLAAYLTGWLTPETLMKGAVAGQFFESWCLAEILKSYVNAGIAPDFAYYRDKDDNEIDLIIQRNGTLYPIEFKKAARVKKDDAKSFSKLSIFQQKIGMGAVVSLYPDVQFVRENVRTVPAWRV